MTDSTSAVCPPQQLCHQWRTCARCARIRQAKIADAVQELHKRLGGLSWSIIHPIPNSGKTLSELRENWLRAAAPAGAIWTIERSAAAETHHCNIIAPTAKPPRIRHAYQSTRIIEGDPRAVAAYIAKPDQAPHPSAWPGRTYGTAGQLWQLLAAATTHPAVAAAATQYAIDSAAMRHAAAFDALLPGQRNQIKWSSAESLRQTKQSMTLTQARTIAARYLPDIIASLKNK